MLNPSALTALPLILSTMGVPTTIKLPASHPIMVRAEKAYEYAIAAVDAEFPKAPQAEKDIWVNRSWGWSGPESEWTVDALGDCNNNAERTIATCRSFGIMQVMNPERWGFSRAAVLSDGVIGYRAGLRVMKHSIATCGSVASGLGMYASGTCGWAQSLVKKRCKVVGDECK